MTLSVGKSRTPVSGASGVTTHRGTGSSTLITAPPMRTRRPAQVSSSCGAEAPSISMVIRTRPRAGGHAGRRHRAPVEVDLERLAIGLGLAGDDDAVREPQLEGVGGLVVRRADRQDRGLGRAREPLAEPVDQEEPAVAGRAPFVKLDAPVVVQRATP